MNTFKRISHAILYLKELYFTAGRFVWPKTADVLCGNVLQTVVRVI